MAGLLDFLNTDDGRLGLGLLAAAGPSAQPMGFGQRLAGAMQGFDDYKRAQIKDKFIQSQIDENTSQAAQRQAKLAQDQKLDDIIAARFGQRPASAAAPALPGQLGSGSFGLLSPPSGVADIPAPRAATPAQGGIASLTPDDLALFKLRGKDLVDVYKLSQPDMQVSNGYAYDKNSVRPGYLPQLNVSQNGQTSMVQIGRDGLPVISAPRGALDTYGAYRRADEGTKADYDTTTVTPQGQNPQLTTRGSLVRTLNQIDPKVQAARDVDRVAILKDEETKAQTALTDAINRGDQSAAARAQADLAALRREIGGKSASVGMPLQSDEEKLRATKGVEGDAKVNEARANDVKTAKKFLSIADQAETLLKAGPTNSGFGSLVDASAAFVGKTTQGAATAQQLKAIGGWLVSNVPRMEGPQSNFDVANYQVMAADVANDALPVPRRMAALQTIKQMMRNTVDNGATGSWDDNNPGAVTAKPLPAAPSAKNLVKDEVYELPGGKRGKWDGMGFRVVP